MIYRNLIRINLLKIFLINLLFLLTVNNIYSQSKLEIYRSNYNGLKLVKINRNESSIYKYILNVYISDSLDNRRILYEDKKEIKKWLYYYNEKKLYLERYYKDNLLIAEYRYDESGHKIKQEDYKNNKKIKITTYTYNKDGLVDIEKIYNILNEQHITVKYRYDNYFQIKQIEKKYSDGKIIYWEAFFSDKGIIQKEFYTLNNEIYTFWYNESGQELKGEVKKIENKKEEITKAWVNYYSAKGKKIKKEENDYKFNRKIITLFNNNGFEIKVEAYKDQKLLYIELFEYNENKKVSSYEIIEELSSNKILYRYNKNNDVVRTLHYTNNELKKVVDYNEDKSRIETIYIQDKRIVVKYDKDGKIIE